MRIFMNIVRKFFLVIGLIAIAFGVCVPSQDPFIVPNTTEDKVAAENIIQDAQKLKGSSQSHTHLNNWYIQKKLREEHGLSRNNHVINAALTREIELAKQGYVVFYTAVPYMRLFQDITRKMYKAVVGKIGALQEKAFQFIRYTYDDPIYKKYRDVQEFLYDEIKKEGIIDDNEIRLRTILVSTNIAFFGNIGFSGESTYNYFNNPQPWVSANPEWLRASLQSFGYSEKFLSELMNLAVDIVTDTGDIFQIFVPINMVDRVGYLSWRQGIPFDFDFISKMFERENMTFGKGDLIFGQEIIDKIAAFKAKYKAKDPEAVQMVKELLENVKNKRYFLSAFLDNYKKGTLAQYKNRVLNFYQARLLIGPWMLDPRMGLKIYRYSTLGEERELMYKERLKEIFKRMEQERQERLMKYQGRMVPTVA